MGGIYIFNLDRYFDYHMDFETLKRNIKLTSGIELTRDIPNLKYKINRYREVWRKAENKTSNQVKRLFLRSSDESQTFTIPYDLPGNCRYELKIDVDKLKDIAKEIDLLEEDDNSLKKYLRGKDYIGKSGSIRGIKLENKIFEENNGMKIDMYSDIVKQIVDFNIEGIDVEYAKTRINAKDPILCLDMTGIKDSFPPFCIVDGNHQAYAKSYLGNGDNIEVYMISRNLWIKCLLTESDKTFVKISNNINCMLGYMTGAGTEEQLNQSLYDLY